VASIEWPILEKIVQSGVNGRNAFLVGMAERREGGRRIIQVFVDTDAGITIAQCAEISREVGAELDAQSVINEPYELEVSSPGIERPLKLLRQYKKNVGRKYKVRYLIGKESRTFSGTLAVIVGEKLTFTAEKKNAITLEFSDIIESIEELPW
jgi:ribosome maturation factor RimP